MCGGKGPPPGEGGIVYTTDEDVRRKIRERLERGSVVKRQSFWAAWDAFVDSVTDIVLPIMRILTDSTVWLTGVLRAACEKREGADGDQANQEREYDV